jgi:AraC family transcriptional regulator, ethanolamine operon transcriptional activator
MTGRLLSVDPDDCASRLMLFGMHMQQSQMSGGKFLATVDILRLPHSQLTLTAYGPAITADGGVPQQSYALGLAVPGTGALSVNHHVHQPHEVAVVSGGRELHLSRAPGVQVISWTVNSSHVDSVCLAMFDRPLSQMARSGLALRSHTAATACAQTLLDLLYSNGPTSLLAGEVAGLDGDVGRRVEDLVLDALLGDVQGREPLRGWSAREKIVSRARDLMESDREEPLTVAEVCAVLSVPLRTLDDAFRTCLGIAPRHFMHSMRLNKVRRALRSGAATSVTEAAMRFGFFHLGRFSSQYRRLFGELPSDTLQRAQR